jgi:hypothetical protein
MLENFFKYLFLIIVGAVGLYVLTRLISYAFAKSWYQVKNQHTEMEGFNNGKKKTNNQTKQSNDK